MTTEERVLRAAMEQGNFRSTVNNHARFEIRQFQQRLHRYEAQEKVEALVAVVTLARIGRWGWGDVTNMQE